MSNYKIGVSLSPQVIKAIWAEHDRRVAAGDAKPSRSAIARTIGVHRDSVCRYLRLPRPDDLPALTVPVTFAPPSTDALHSALKTPRTLDELAATLGCTRGAALDRIDELRGSGQLREDGGRYWLESAPEPTVADVVATDRQRIRLEAQLKETERRYDETLRQLEESEARQSALLSVQESVSPVKIEADLSVNGGQATAIWQASDWHVGERVEPSTINYLNEYNPDIATARAKRFFQNGLKLVRKERQDVQIDTLILWLGGDLITGYIHDELEESNYLSPTEESLLAKQLIMGGLKLLKEDGEFKRIIVPTSFGNHGRTTKKRRISTGYRNSYEWMLYKELEAHYQGDDVIEMRVVNGYLNYVDCYSYPLVFHHGDDTYYKGGVGGMTVPLLKYIARIDQQRRVYMHSIGHYHTRLPFAPWYRFQANSSLIGYNAYAQSIGASPETPTQNFQLLDAARGATIAAPIVVEG